jgi:hypothetical protein
MCHRQYNRKAGQFVTQNVSCTSAHFSTIRFCLESVSIDKITELAEVTVIRVRFCMNEILILTKVKKFHSSQDLTRTCAVPSTKIIWFSQLLRSAVVCVCVCVCTCYQLLPVEAWCCSRTMLSSYRTFAHFWLVKLSSGRTEVSNVCSSSNSGFTKQTPCPCHLGPRLGPPTSSARLFSWPTKHCSHSYVCSKVSFPTVMTILTHELLLIPFLF